MKTKHLFRYAIAFAIMPACIASAGCSDDETVEADHILLSADTYTFSDGDGETFKIDVRANVPWTVEIENDWIIQVARDDNSVTLGVQSNPATALRTGKVSFTGNGTGATFVARQLPASYKGTFRNLDEWMGGSDVSMSPGGQYVAGMAAELLPSDEYQFVPEIIETATGKRTRLDPVTMYDGIRAVSDDGRTVILSHSGNALTSVSTDNIRHEPGLPAGYAYPYIEAVSADGSVWVGTCKDLATRANHPVKWTDGVPELLPEPENNALGQPVSNGILARGCSADGSVVYGTEWDWFGIVYWKDGKVAYAGQELIKPHTETIQGVFGPTELQLLDRPKLEANNQRISADGRYLAGTYTAEYIEGNYVFANNYPFLFDIETGKATVLTDNPDEVGLTADDEGNYYLGAPAMGTSAGYVYDNAGNHYELREWAAQRYGIVLNDNRVISKISPDGKVVFGYRPVTAAQGLAFGYWYYVTEGEQPAAQE